MAEPSPGRVFVLPASDEADEVVAAMLAQLLEQAGYSALPFTAGPSPHQIIDTMRPEENDTFCISALPPFAFSSGITLARQLQLRFPRTPVLVGVWGFAGDPARALERFLPSRPVALVTTLAGAVQFRTGREYACRTKSCRSLRLGRSGFAWREASPISTTCGHMTLRRHYTLGCRAGTAEL